MAPPASFATPEAASAIPSMSPSAAAGARASTWKDGSSAVGISCRVREQARDADRADAARQPALVRGRAITRRA
jgi:hypothetical protein